jgi:hypothetical protein
VDSHTGEISMTGCIGPTCPTSVGALVGALVGPAVGYVVGDHVRYSVG